MRHFLQQVAATLELSSLRLGTRILANSSCSSLFAVSKLVALQLRLSCLVSSNRFAGSLAKLANEGRGFRAWCCLSFPCEPHLAELFEAAPAIPLLDPRAALFLAKTTRCVLACAPHAPTVRQRRSLARVAQRARSETVTRGAREVCVVWQRGT